VLPDINGPVEPVGPVGPINPVGPVGPGALNACATIPVGIITLELIAIDALTAYDADVGTPNGKNLLIIY
jgi:hypothetical protein